MMDENNTNQEETKKFDKEDQSEIKNGEESLEKKLKETEEKLLRSLAEIENQRRRFEKEIKDAFEFGGFNFAKESLALLDNLQRAKKSISDDDNLKDSKDLNKYIKNLEVIENNLITIFEKNKIKKINCLKDKFDPNYHQAMMEIEDESVEVGTIINEIQPGYMFGDRLLRPSFVGVSKKKANKKDDNKGKK
tara:strand:+ start:619 stop:1194 length:576 start_codon:yes stop_codon:yes gene_type:complete